MDTRTLVLLYRRVYSGTCFFECRRKFNRISSIRTYRTGSLRERGVEKRTKPRCGIYNVIIGERRQLSKYRIGTTTRFKRLTDRALWIVQFARGDLNRIHRDEREGFS